MSKDQNDPPPSQRPPLYAIRPGTLPPGMRIGVLRDQEGVCLTCRAWLMPQQYFCFETSVGATSNIDGWVPYFGVCRACCEGFLRNRIVWPSGSNP